MERLYKYRQLIISVLFTVAFVSVYLIFFSVNYNSYAESIENSFIQKEKDLNDFLNQQKQSSSGSIDSLWQGKFQNSPFYLHIYQNDSLIFWNSNQVPVNRFADIHYPAEGILHLQNGWYFAKFIQRGKYKIAASFLIKQDYPYENENLKNVFAEDFYLPFEAGISLDQENEYNIKDENGNYLFSIIPKNKHSINFLNELIFLFLFFIALISWLYYLYVLGKALHPKLKWIIPLLVLMLSIISVKYNFLEVFDGLAILNHELYNYNYWFPNFLGFVCNAILLFYFVFSFRDFLLSIAKDRFSGIINLILLILSTCYWHFIIILIKSLFTNSTISLAVDQLFSLNIYSLYAIITISGLLYSYYIFVKLNAEFWSRSNQWYIWNLTAIIFISLSYLLVVYCIDLKIQLYGLVPLFTNLLMIFYANKAYKTKKFGIGLIQVVFFALVLSSVLANFNSEKEYLDKQELADILATDQDIKTEKDYSNIVGLIQDDKVIQRFINSPRRSGHSEFENGIENRIFKPFSEKYEMAFELFDTLGVSLILGNDTQKNSFSYLNDLIIYHGRVSKWDSNFYFIADNAGQYSYIAKQPIIKKDSTRAIGGYLFCTFKSKKLPEEIGFPRLLIPSKAQVFKLLEKYSIAKYHNHKLITRYGEFNYPTIDRRINEWINEDGNYSYHDDYSHYLLKQNNGDIIILSSRTLGLKELITSFSYLFCLFCILLLPILFQFNKGLFTTKAFSLAFKIQLTFIGFVTVSLVAFGWGSGLFVSKQYSQYKDVLIKEKLVSVLTEMKGKLGNEKTLTIEENGNFIDNLLQKFAKVFVTDINLYDKDGFLLGSSRAKVFNIGLLSEQMNPTALQAMKFNNNSEFIHDEFIGRLNYSSAYQPFFNNSGKLVGYINLQHFGQQNDFENQIQLFLVAIINVFIFLLAISIIISILISRWVTSPLRQLQENFSSLKFGTKNQRIHYEKEDEIGALVKDYNLKLQELENTATQLAQSERESAWREMAKQVAHEIKNPLTPMKLSIQHLLRAYDPKDPQFNEKLKKVANSLIEQIDSLTKIANEFSNFAKMPKQNIEILDLVPIIESVIEVFRQNANCALQWKSTIPNAMVNADKDQIIRVLNNLITNGLQAIPVEKEGLIVLELISLPNQQIQLTITDNGSGISDDQTPNIFVPYFTTKSTGTGLGLAMVKQIIESLNGTISFTSIPGQGTTFKIVLPRNTDKND